MILLPSPVNKVTVVLNAPLVQVGVAPEATPLPATVTTAPSTEQVPITATEPAEGREAPEPGKEITTIGEVLFTVRAVPLGPTAALEFVAASASTPAGRLRVTVPSPVQLDKVTVRVAVPVPVTALLQLAVPVRFKITSVFARVTVFTPTASLKVRSQVAVAVLANTLGLTLPKEIVGAVLSLTTVRPIGALAFPARSVWLTLTTLLPSPALNVTVAV